MTTFDNKPMGAQTMLIVLVAFHLGSLYGGKNSKLHIQNAVAAVQMMQDSLENTSKVNEAKTIKLVKKASESCEFVHKNALAENYWELALTEQNLYGIPASIKLAQLILESGSMKSGLFRNSNNAFGIKHRGIKGIYNEIRPGVLGKYKAKDDCGNKKCDFVKYKTFWYSWRHHSLLLSRSKRYRNFPAKYGINYRKWAHGLKKAGYATDRKYAEKLIAIIEDFDLDQYDVGYGGEVSSD